MNNLVCGCLPSIISCAENHSQSNHSLPELTVRKQLITALDKDRNKNKPPQDLSLLSLEEWRNLDIAYFVTENLQYFIKGFVLKITSKLKINSSQAREIAESAPSFVYLAVLEPITHFHKKNLNLEGNERNTLLFGIGFKSIEFQSLTFFKDQFNFVELDKDISILHIDTEEIYDDGFWSRNKEDSNTATELNPSPDLTDNSFDQRVLESPLNSVLSLLNCNGSISNIEEIFLLSDDTPSPDTHERIQHAMIESVSSLLSKKEITLLRCLLTEGGADRNNRSTYTQIINGNEEICYYPGRHLRRKLQEILDDPTQVEAVRNVFSKGFSL